jgi:hypothetical protein
MNYLITGKKITTLSFLMTLVLAACAGPDTALQPTVIEKRIVKGHVTDATGKPLANVKVVIENTVFYASYVYAVTNAAGNYRVAVPNGSWKASVKIDKLFEGKVYHFDLHPDNEAPFAGSRGAIRNFSWKLNNEKPDGTRFYGGQVAVYNEPGSSLSMNEVELTLTPNGLLADGSTGKPITKTLIDIGGGEDGIRDVPIGKYNITARNTNTGKPLQVRLRNKGNYVNMLEAKFESGFTGITTYQIVIQVQEQ